MNKEDLTIGILIPVYNVADYVEECIESILTQIDTRASILIMNDASTDNSAAISSVLKTILKCKSSMRLIIEVCQPHVMRFLI